MLRHSRTLVETSAPVPVVPAYRRASNSASLDSISNAASFAFHLVERQRSGDRQLRGKTPKQTGERDLFGAHLGEVDMLDPATVPYSLTSAKLTSSGVSGSTRCSPRRRRNTGDCGAQQGRARPTPRRVDVARADQHRRTATHGHGRRHGAVERHNRAIKAQREAKARRRITGQIPAGLSVDGHDPRHAGRPPPL
jgi:hypothetical protein